MKHWITIVRARMITQKLRNIQWTNIHQIEDSLRAIHHRQLLLQKHTSIYHHHLSSVRSINIVEAFEEQRETQDIFSTDGIYSGVGNSSLVEGGRIPPYSKASAFAHAQTISTYFQPGSLETCAHALSTGALTCMHTSACTVRAHAPSVAYIYIYYHTVYIYMYIYICKREKCPL